MAYTNVNYPTKKALKAAVAEADVPCFQPGGMFPLTEGPNVIEGPHYPKPHRFYAAVTITNGVIVKGSKVT